MSNLGMVTVSLYIYKKKYKNANTEVLYFKHP